MDYQATTPLDPRVARAMAPYWAQRFGNPHSQDHHFGWEAREAVEVARGQVADLIGADDEEIVFLSGATESCNLAIRGVADATHDRRQVVTVATEHPAVLESVKWLASRGFDVRILPVMGDGLLDLNALEDVLSERTLLVSVMLANNEIGVIQPIREIAELARAVGAIVHTDATQAVGRIAVDVDELSVDLLSLSGHKFYGPNGIGILYVRGGVSFPLEPILTGGAQEKGLRPGTLATPLVVGLGEACEIVANEWQADARRINHLTSKIWSSMRSAFPEMRLFGHRCLRIPGSLSIGLPGIPAEQVVDAVSEQLAISTGSACSTGSPKPSHVLVALGYDQEIAATAIRVSLGRFTTQEEVDAVSKTMQNALMTTAGGLAK